MTSPTKKPSRPSDAVIAEALGPSRSLWNDLRHQMARDFAPITEEWVFGGKKHGWALRLKRRDRAVLYLQPLEQYFRASLALGPRAVQAARGEKLPARVLRLIDEAVQYPEGKAVRLDIRDPKDTAIAIQLAAIKLDV